MPVSPTPYAYSSTPTQNPFRWLLAAWRVSRDLTNTDEAAIVEIGFSTSRLGRRYAGWNAEAEKLASDPCTADALSQRRRIGEIDLPSLQALPPGNLGHVFAAHCRAHGLNPNLADLWANNDELGEVGLAASTTDDSSCR